MSDEQNQQSENVSDYRFSFRSIAEEMVRVERLMEYMKSKGPSWAKVTQKSLFLEALDALEARDSRAMKDRERRSKRKDSQSNKEE